MKSIVVVDKKWGIGKENGLLFRLPLDLKQFKEKTLNKVVVMGSNTFRSLPFGALPNRVNIVLNRENEKIENALTVNDLSTLFELLKKFPSDDVFVIGGASVYKLMLEFCDTVFVTKVDADGDAEVFFPNLDENPDWKLVSESEIAIDNGFETRYCEYIKILKF